MIGRRVAVCGDSYGVRRIEWLGPNAPVQEPRSRYGLGDAIVEFAEACRRADMRMPVRVLVDWLKDLYRVARGALSVPIPLSLPNPTLPRCRPRSRDPRHGAYLRNLRWG